MEGERPWSWLEEVAQISGLSEIFGYTFLHGVYLDWEHLEWCIARVGVHGYCTIRTVREKDFFEKKSMLG